MTIYVICLVLGLAFTLISAIAGHFFGGHDTDASVGTDGHAEAGFDHSGIPGISFFSPTVMASFVTAFGAFGMIFTKIEPTSSAWISAPLSSIGAIGVAFAVFYMFNVAFKRLQGSSESKISRLAGTDATIITPVPANGVGEIAYVQGGTRYTAPARTEDGSPAGNGQVVKITRVVGTQFYVEIKHQSSTQTAT
jgi:membrane protein implicated in regulation of membrane protease activity